MSAHHFWLSDEQFARIHPILPDKPRGVPRVDDWRVISGITYVNRDSLMWRDAPEQYGPHKTLYNRFVRWSALGVFNRIFEGCPLRRHWFEPNGRRRQAAPRLTP